jgi:hypothetical protein
MIDGVLAKHGYTVDWGFFNGVCSGAHDKPLEHDHSHTDAIIKVLREVEAVNADKRAADLKSGAVEPTFYRRGKWDGRKCRFEQIECTRAELSDYDAQQAILGAIHRAESKARHARSHASMLEKLIETRFGQPLYPVSDRKELTVGDRVLIGGKKGVICEVVEIKREIARGCGPYMNGKLLLHAMLKRPDGRIIAVPTQTIRQSAIVTDDLISNPPTGCKVFDLNSGRLIAEGGAQ